MSEQSLSQVDLNLLILEIRSMLPIELDDTNEANVEELAFGALEKVTEGLLNRFNCLVAITQERNYKLLSHIELLESKTENFRPGDFVVAKQIAREVGWVKVAVGESLFFEEYTLDSCDLYKVLDVDSCDILIVRNLRTSERKYLPKRFFQLAEVYSKGGD
ncbi:hypothetical protein OAI95_00905 [Candidatus Poseidoniales archaeon]|nr:hypothetical protein [Candidatus Poseidoniales archaeon]